MAPITSMLRQALTALPRGGTLTKITKQGATIHYFNDGINIVRRVVPKTSERAVSYVTKLPKNATKFPISKGMNDLSKSPYNWTISNGNGSLSRTAADGSLIMTAPTSLGEKVTLLTSNGNGLLVGRPGLVSQEIAHFTKPQSNKLIQAFLWNDPHAYDNVGRMIYQLA